MSTELLRQLKFCRTGKNWPLLTDDNILKFQNILKLILKFLVFKLPKKIVNNLCFASTRYSSDVLCCLLSGDIPKLIRASV